MGILGGRLSLISEVPLYSQAIGSPSREGKMRRLESSLDCLLSAMFARQRAVHLGGFDASDQPEQGLYRDTDETRQNLYQEKLQLVNCGA